MNYIKWLWHNTRGIRGNMLLRILVGIGQVSLALLMVWLCRYFIDVAIKSDSQVIVRTVVSLVLVVAGNIALRQLYFYTTIRATAYQATQVRLRIFGHLLRRRIYDDEKPLHSGDVTSRLETDVSAISDAVAGTLPQLVVTTVKLVGAFLLLYSMDRQLAWMLLLSTPLLVVMGKLFARRLRSMTHDVREQDSRIQMLVQEGMEHNAMLRAMESGSWLTGQLGTMQQGLLSKIERRTRFTLVARSVMAVCFGFGYLLAFIWGGLQLRDGIITFGDSPIDSCFCQYRPLGGTGAERRRGRSAASPCVGGDTRCPCRGRHLPLSQWSPLYPEAVYPRFPSGQSHGTDGRDRCRQDDTLPHDVVVAANAGGQYSTL